MDDAELPHDFSRHHSEAALPGTPTNLGQAVEVQNENLVGQVDRADLSGPGCGADAGGGADAGDGCLGAQLEAESIGGASEEHADAGAAIDEEMKWSGGIVSLDLDPKESVLELKGDGLGVRPSGQGCPQASAHDDPRQGPGLHAGREAPRVPNRRP